MNDRHSIEARSAVLLAGLVAGTVSCVSTDVEVARMLDDRGDPLATWVERARPGAFRITRKGTLRHGRDRMEVMTEMTGTRAGTFELVFSESDPSRGDTHARALPRLFRSTGVGVRRNVDADPKLLEGLDARALTDAMDLATFVECPKDSELMFRSGRSTYRCRGLDVIWDTGVMDMELEDTGLLRNKQFQGASGRKVAIHYVYGANSKQGAYVEPSGMSLTITPGDVTLDLTLDRFEELPGTTTVQG